MGTEPMKLIYERFIAGSMRLMVVTTAPGDQGLRVKQLVPEGTPYWGWPTTPPGRIIAADFTDAPLCSSDVAVNNANLGSITVDPASVLTYE